VVGEVRPVLRCRGLTKAFGEVHALDGFDLDVPAGRVVALLGPSACGKTTALRVIAGFEAPDSGSVEVEGRLVAGPGVFLPPEKRRTGMVFQDYALFPHLDVRGNVAYGLPRRGRDERLGEVLELVHLLGVERRYPHELSGGQQQRVALARTLAPRPALLLLDEPFSNLDVHLRRQVRADIREVLAHAGTTTLFVTHDQEEAFYLAETVAVMRAGRVEQVGAPEELYSRPVSRFVAEFVGIANFLPARRDGDALQTELGVFPANGLAPGDAFDVLLRPDDIVIGEGRAVAAVEEREFQGHDLMYTLRLPSGLALRTIQPPGIDLRAGQKVAIASRIEEPPAFPRPSES
jgi:iron(III) transport system ATP-binding protein